MARNFLTALPVFNEVKSVASVLEEVKRYSERVLVVDDGSVDGTSDVLAGIPGIQVVRHEVNRGYGAALATAFEFAARNEYEVLVSIDCDGQHEPCRIQRFVDACSGWDIVSGSRYLKKFPRDSEPPEARRRINIELTNELNRRLGLSLTDAFCGFKAYRVSALSKLQITQTGYAMPLELWVQAAHAGLRIRELPVPLIYLDLTRSFGGQLDSAEVRRQHYLHVLQQSLERVGRSCFPPKSPAMCGESG